MLIRGGEGSVDLDLDEARAETRALYEERGLSDADLTYLEADIDPSDYGASDPAALAELGAIVDDPGSVEAASEGTWISAHTVWFVGGPGSRVYYKAANPRTRVCHPYSASAPWLQRSLYGRCRSGGAYIWYILVRV